MLMLVTALTAMLAMIMMNYFGQKITQEHVISKLSVAAREVSEYIHQVDSSAINSTKMLKVFLSMSTHDFSKKETMQLLGQVLNENPFIQSLYVGSENEDFFQIIHLKSSVTVRDKMNADSNDRWVTLKATGTGTDRQMFISYVDSDFKVNRTVVSKTSFYPTQRPWFVKAVEKHVKKTEPYLFKHMKVTGLSYAIRSGEDVIGIDVELSMLNKKVTATALEMSLESDVESFIFNHNGEVVASNINLERDIEIPVSAPLALTEPQRALVMNTPVLSVSNQNDWGPYDFSQAGEPQGFTIDLLKMLAQKTGLKFDFINGFESNTLSEKYLRGTINVLHSVSGEVPSYGERSSPMYSTELAIAGKNQRSLPVSLESVTAKLGVVSGFGMKEWLQAHYSGLDIIEFDSLSDARYALAKGELPYLVDSFLTLDELNRLENTPEITVKKLDSPPTFHHMYINQKYAGLLDVLNLAIASITPEQLDYLKQKWLESDHWRGTFLPYPEVFQLVKDTSNYNTVVQQSIEGENHFVYVTPIPSSIGGDDYFSVIIPGEIINNAVNERLFKSSFVSALFMLCLFPLAWRLGKPMTHSIYALRENTKKIRDRNVDQSFSITTRVKEIHELSETMMEMMAEIQSHEKQQEEFIEAFIRLIAQAIDDKSPYTAGHCNRVPEIGMMLADAAEKCQSGKLKDFAFKSEAERREFRIAAWLHDCGKITTPEHIVDKGTKLEANYNRIHEIRTRFEVLRRDAKIEYLHALLHDEVNQEKAEAEFEEKVRQLNDDFEFLANANIGGEFMSEDKIARVKQIADKTWLRYFDDRLGLSPFEEMNTPEQNASLPVMEKLLQDKSEHIIRRIRPVEFEPEHRIQMQVPEHLYNMGEVYNLTISRGTLTPEDRFKINEHMISGIKMLEALPFPPELSNVPRYASTHHETLKGTGYPRKLNGDDLSIPERILVIADIFEALTAGDRPYKKAMSITVAIDTMYQMALEEHLDIDLFLLFLESGVYLDYAKKFLPESHVFEVDIQKYRLTKPSKV